MERWVDAHEGHLRRVQTNRYGAAANRLASRTTVRERRSEASSYSQADSISDSHRTWGAARGDLPTMTTTPRSTVVGVFHDREDAREAIEALKEDDFNTDTISILSPDKQDTGGDGR